MVGPFLGPCRCVALRASVTLRLLHPPRTVILQGIIPAMTRVTNPTARQVSTAFGNVRQY